jgi:hypothetical protein
MSFAGITDLRNDQDFIGRVTAANVQEALTVSAGTPYAGRVLSSPEGAVVETIWQVCSAPGFSEAYDSALASETPNPGRDPAVISDEQITAAAHAVWPAN